jgi:hypothetical protein
LCELVLNARPGHHWDRAGGGARAPADEGRLKAIVCVFRDFRRAISLESGRRFRCKAAPCCEGFSVLASTYRC